MQNYKPDTLCIHAGYKPGNGEPRVVPIVQSTTYTYDSSKEMGDLFDLQADGFFYTRIGNPTNDVVEKKIAALECGVGALLTSSGQAASLMAVLNICTAGDHVVSSSAIYGGTFNLFYKTIKEMGIETTFVSPTSTREELKAAMRENTKCVFAETLANPSLIVADLETFAEAAHEHGVPLIVDNTFPTPINCQPFAFGADIVVHSTTKYMDGHAVQVGGVIVDSGKFDWQNGKFPALTEPDESYHGVIYTKQAEKAIKEITDLGFGDIPVCVAKTQYSLSDDPTKLGKPENYEITVRDVRLSAGAGFVVAYTGDIMTMPGLPKKPAAYNIDCDNEGNIYGLF